MPRGMPADTLSALQETTQLKKILIAIFAASSTYRWCSGLQPITSDMEGSSELYVPRGVEVDPPRIAGDDSPASAIIDDTDGILLGEVLNDGLTGRRVLIGQQLLRGEAGSWTAAEVIADGLIERCSIDQNTARLQIGTRVGWRNRSGAAPCQRTCTLLFRSDRCGYSGPDTTCNHTWTDCSAKGNTARMRAFRLLPQPGQSIRIAKQGFQISPPPSESGHPTPGRDERRVTRVKRDVANRTLRLP